MPPTCGRIQTRTCDTACYLLTEFIDPITRICKPCDLPCEKCSVSSFHCDSCMNPRYLTSKNECVLICPAPKYVDDESKTCNNDCSSLKFKHDVDRKCYKTCPEMYYGDFNTKKCVGICPDDTWPDSNSKLCKFCGFNCGKCNGEETACGGICSQNWLIGETCNIPSCNQFTLLITKKIFLILFIL